MLGTAPGYRKQVEQDKKECEHIGGQYNTKNEIISVEAGHSLLGEERR
jgi:hypothetical protein